MYELDFVSRFLEFLYFILLFLEVHMQALFHRHHFRSQYVFLWLIKATVCKSDIKDGISLSSQDGAMVKILQLTSSSIFFLLFL